ncbi:hypothetical protein K3495_g10168 [Podosphaera aphanis]|nr:hypothetical protein K3495_g10168 [Podosphaera aphanis]
MVTYYLQINDSAPVENLSHRVNPFVTGHPGCTVCGFNDHSENVRVVMPPRPRSGGGRVPDRHDPPRWDEEKERAVTPDAAHVPSEARPRAVLAARAFAAGPASIHVPLRTTALCTAAVAAHTTRIPDPVQIPRREPKEMGFGQIIACQARTGPARSRYRSTDTHPTRQCR